MAIIRQARPDDIPGIAVVVRQVWDQALLPDVCVSQIQQKNSALWVAAIDERVVGFVSAFVTVGADGLRRWEVDLLAVLAESRGQRLGQRLVDLICRDAPRDVAMARAIIHEDNRASQITFERAGFAKNGRRYAFLLWPPDSDGVPVYEGAVNLIPVDTVTYRGLWIEGLDEVDSQAQRQAVTAARTLVGRGGRSNAGALVPEDEARLDDSVRQAAERVGVYQQFYRKLM